MYDSKKLQPEANWREGKSWGVDSHARKAGSTLVRLHTSISDGTCLNARRCHPASTRDH